MRALVLLVALASSAAISAAEEVVVFANGDRLSGTIAARGTKRVRFKTPYGLLVIPNEQIERLVYADGREEVVTPPPPPATPPPPAVRLVVVVTGDTFWQAWDPPAAPADPSLRLSVALDQTPIVTFVDANLDPEDLPGAVVNSFVYSPDRLLARPADGVNAAPPERARGGVRLAFELPVGMAGPRRLRFAYEVNDATSSVPRWRAVTESGADVLLAVDETTVVRLVQSRGQMEYHRGSMRRVETFHAVFDGTSGP